MSQEFERFAAYLKVSDRLIQDASKDEIAEVARVLAHYQKKYEAIPVQESLRLLLTETIEEDQAGELADEELKNKPQMFGEQTPLQNTRDSSVQLAIRRARCRVGAKTTSNLR